MPVVPCLREGASCRPLTACMLPDSLGKARTPQRHQANTQKTHRAISRGWSRWERFSRELPPLRGLRHRAGAIHAPGPRHAVFPKMPGAFAVVSWPVPLLHCHCTDATVARLPVPAARRFPERFASGGVAAAGIPALQGIAASGPLPDAGRGHGPASPRRLVLAPSVGFRRTVGFHRTCFRPRPGPACMCPSHPLDSCFSSRGGRLPVDGEGGRDADSGPLPFSEPRFRS